MLAARDQECPWRAAGLSSTSCQSAGSTPVAVSGRW
jgi:hypothetical protein